MFFNAGIFFQFYLNQAFWKVTAAPSIHQRGASTDPGYIDNGKLVLASTKAQAHRIYIGQGVYAEVTLLYHHGAYHPFIYTYEDYRGQYTNNFLIQVRKKFLQQKRDSKA